MLAVLPLLAFALLAVGFHRKRLAWRESLLFASIPSALFLAFITELLTQFRILTRSSVALSWFGFVLLCFAWMYGTKRAETIGPNNATEKQALSWAERVALSLTILIVALIALTAVASAPNTWDAMEYHLPRVVEWVNNRGVQFYPTIDRFQLDQPPFAEYIMLHLLLLYGSDRLVALVEWFSYVGCILVTSLIAKELGGAKRTQIVAAIFCATIPTAVLEASGTKTELTAAYWIAASVYLLLRWRRNQAWAYALAIGATLGLAVFSKGTSYAFLPFLILVCVLILNRTARRYFFLRLPLMVGMGILVCAPLWIRNYQYTGSPLGLPYLDGAGSINGRMLRTARITPATTIANMARNIALQVGVPNDRINAFSTRVFSKFIWAIDDNPNDPGQLNATSFGDVPKFRVRFYPRYEVLAGNPLPLFLLLLAGALFPVYHRKIGKEVGWLGLGLVGGFALHSALLRWSQWNSRYEIPIFMVGAALSAVILVRILPIWTIYAIVGLSLLIALPLALLNETRPLVTRQGLRGSILTTPRDEMYFFDFHREIAGSFIAAAAAARTSGCRSIGIDANLLHYEYPIMALLSQDGVFRHIRYVGVENSSVRYVQRSAPPVCMVICLQCLHAPKKIAEYSAKLPEMRLFGTVVLFSH